MSEGHRDNEHIEYTAPREVRRRKPTQKNDALHRELQRRKEAGMTQVSVAELERLCNEIGYYLDRSMDCRAPATIMTGPGAGDTYPCCTTDVKEIDTRRSAFHNEARRDQNYERLKELRWNYFAVSKGHILEI